MRLLRWATIDQYQRIDEDYLQESERYDPRALIVLVSIPLSLMLMRYFGGRSYMRSVAWLSAAIAELPYKEMHAHLYWAAFKTVSYFLAPALVIKLVLKERIRDFGFTGTTSRRVWLLYLAMLLAMLPIVYVASHSPAFLASYPKYKLAGRSLEELVVWELAYGYQFLMLEFFFRGYILFALARYVGHRAIFIMVVPYTMIHFSKPIMETLGSVLAGTALGTLALRTRSIYGGVLLHCGVAWSMDLFALSQQGKLGALLGY